MIKFIFFLLAFSLLFSCSTVKTETAMNGHFTYTEKESWRKIRLIPDENNKSPKLLIKTLTVIKDSLSTITYTTREKYKKHKNEFYISAATTDQTKKSKKANPKYKPYDFIMEGTFLQHESRSSYRYRNEKIIFNTDGTCVHYWKTTCSDSPCDSEYKQMGIYKISSDTVYIVYYLGKTITTYYPLRDKPKVNIDNLTWKVKPLVETNYILSKSNDSLTMISNEGREILNGIIIHSSDSIKLIPTTSYSSEMKKAKAQMQKMDDAYNRRIQNGDREFNAKNWEVARAWYSEAISIKPTEQYPKTKILEIDLNYQRENNQQYEEIKYQDLILKADDYFENKKYDQALELYNRAIAIQPSDESIKTKIDKCKLEIEKNKK